jgi:ABC-type nitrate/sulfonate/bicarbonate transport system substrate-binding protein
LAAAPQNSPAKGVVAALSALGGPTFELMGLAPQQVLLELTSGRGKAALLPEPMATVALSKNPELKIIANLEEEYALLSKGLPRLPQAGVALNQNFADAYPDLAGELVALMVDTALELKEQSPSQIVALLPQSTKDNLGAENLERSLSRDLLLALPAWEIKEEINSFLCLAVPELCENGSLKASFPQTFVFTPEN